MSSLRFSSFMIFVVLTLLVQTRAAAQKPLFVTQTPTSGNTGNRFFIFLPVANIGSVAATSMQLTSVTLNFLGQPVATLEQPAVLPFVTGSGYLGSGAVRTLDLEFDNSKLAAGNKYLLTVRGTYQSNGGTFGFVLNRPLTYANGFAVSHQQVIDTILAKFATRPRVDRQADDEMMQAFVMGLPQVSSADVQVNPPTVLVMFNDGGEPLVLLNNVKLPLQPVKVDGTASSYPFNLRKDRLSTSASVAPNAGDLVTRVATELPKSNQVRVLNALGSGFPTAASTIESLLTANGYQLALGATATEQSLREVSGDAVFYISTHAGVIGNHFFLWT